MCSRRCAISTVWSWRGSRCGPRWRCSRWRAPHWLAGVIDLGEWNTRYGRRIDSWRLPTSAGQRDELAGAYGADAATLCQAVTSPEAPAWLRELPAMAVLRTVLIERTGRSLVLTSNRSPADWYPLFPNPGVAESLLDRLINTSHQVLMDGPSYRPNKRPGRDPLPAKETTE